MKITYDKDIDAMYLQFQKGVFVRNKEVAEGIILDMGKGDKILGIEILEASKRIKPKNETYINLQVPMSLAVA